MWGKKNTCGIIYTHLFIQYYLLFHFEQFIIHVLQYCKVQELECISRRPDPGYFPFRGLFASQYSYNAFFSHSSFCCCQHSAVCCQHTLLSEVVLDWLPVQLFRVPCFDAVATYRLSCLFFFLRNICPISNAPTIKPFTCCLLFVFDMTIWNCEHLLELCSWQRFEESLRKRIYIDICNFFYQ